MASTHTQSLITICQYSQSLYTCLPILPLTQVPWTVNTPVKGGQAITAFLPPDRLHVLLNALKMISCPKCAHLPSTHASDTFIATAEYGKIPRLQTSAACSSKKCKSQSRRREMRAKQWSRKAIQLLDKGILGWVQVGEDRGGPETLY